MNVLNATITNITTFQAGSSNSVITGFDLQNRVNVDPNVSNIIITRNLISIQGIGIGTTSNIFIEGNYILGSIFGNNANNVTNIFISNNYIQIRISGLSGVFENNIIEGSIGIGSGIPIVTNSTVRNNIFTRSGSDIINRDISNKYFNNIFIVSEATVNLDPTSSFNNVFDVTLSDLFVGLPNNTTDSQWQLKQNSPAIGAGMDGTDCGIFGGNNPYVLSGIPSGPHIFELSAPRDASSQGGLPVTIKAKISN